MSRRRTRPDLRESSHLTDWVVEGDVATVRKDNAMFEHLQLTDHAQARSQTRATRIDAIDVILTYGREEPRGFNRHTVYMDKAARRCARKALGKTAYAQIEARLNLCVILGRDDRIVRCKHRNKRVRLSVS